MLVGPPLSDVLIGWQGAPPDSRARLLRTFCSGVRLPSLISNSVALVLMSLLILGETSAVSHYAWVAAVVLGGFLPRAYALHLRRLDEFEIATSRKALGFVVISAVYGLVWGAGPFLLLPVLNGTAVGILLLVMVLGTIMGPYAVMPGILYARLATTGLATLAAVALYTTPQLTLAGVITFTWLILRTDVWRGYHAHLRQQFELQQALEQRQAQLEGANRSKERTNRILKQMAETDSLTGAANRRHFMKHLRAQREATALILFDVDYFKAVNDSFGHQVGDAVLVELVALVQEILRKDDLLARLGGEEFAIVLTDMDAASALALAERVRCRVQDHAITVGDTEVRITVSLGVAVVPAGRHAPDASMLLRDADAALYAAKDGGRNRTQLADSAADILPTARPAAG